MKKGFILLGFFALLAFNFVYGQKKVKMGNYDFVLPGKPSCTFEGRYDNRMITYQHYLEIKSDTLYIYSLRFENKMDQNPFTLEVTIVPISLIDFESSEMVQNAADEKLCGYTVSLSINNTKTHFQSFLYTKQSRSEPGKLLQAFAYTDNVHLLDEIQNKKLSDSK